MKLGYCADIPFLKAKEQHAALEAHGVIPKHIYMEGREDETFSALVDACRRGDEVAVYGSLRVLGLTRGVIVSRIRELRERGAVVVDIETGQKSDEYGVDMIDAALKHIHGSRKMKDDRKFARRIAKKAVKAKLEIAKLKRMPEEIAGPIWRQKKLTVAERLELMNPVDPEGRQLFIMPWTEATARRRLG